MELHYGCNYWASRDWLGYSEFQPKFSTWMVHDNRYLIFLVSFWLLNLADNYVELEYSLLGCLLAVFGRNNRGVLIIWFWVGFIMFGWVLRNGMNLLKRMRFSSCCIWDAGLILVTYEIQYWINKCVGGRNHGNEWNWDELNCRGCLAIECLRVVWFCGCMDLGDEPPEEIWFNCVISWWIVLCVIDWLAAILAGLS